MEHANEVESILELLEHPIAKAKLLSSQFWNNVHSSSTFSVLPMNTNLAFHERKTSTKKLELSKFMV